MSLDPKLLEILVCPQDKGPLTYSEEKQLLINERLGVAYRVEDGIPVLLADEAQPGTWAIHTDAEKTLRALGERGDIIRTMQRAMRGEPRELAVFEPGDDGRTIIGRVAAKGLADELRAFIATHGGRGVIKPLQGSGGHGVFVVKDGDAANLNQMIEAVIRDGYAIAQEYLPGAAEGDLRLLTLNGRPLRVDGRYACFRRYNDSGDARSNISAGGKYEAAVPDADALRLAEIAAAAEELLTFAKERGVEILELF